MLLDLADPMARHISDMTQTDFPQNGGPAPLAKELTRDPVVPATTRTVTNVHDQPDNSRRLSSGIDTGGDGQYFRGDRVEFFQTQTLPTQQQPVFEKMLLPEKQRSKKQNIPDPKDNVAKLTYAGNDLNDVRPPQQNRDRTDGLNHQHRTEHQNQPEHQRHRAQQYRSDYQSNRQPDRGFDHQTERNFDQPVRQMQRQTRDSTTDWTDYRLNQDYSRQSTYNYSKNHQNYDSFRRSPGSNRQQHSGRRKSSCCSSGDDERQASAIQPGFVANAAKFWDSKAKKKSNELNTIV